MPNAKSSLQESKSHPHNGLQPLSRSRGSFFVSSLYEGEFFPYI